LWIDREPRTVGLWSVGNEAVLSHHEGVKTKDDRVQRGPRLPRTLALVLGGILLTLSACGGEDAVVRGIVRDQPLEVGGVSVTDVTSEGAYRDHDERFEFVAQPGRLLVVYFGFTNCPDLCPTTLALVRAARRELGRDGDRIDVAMVTVDPSRDTAEVMNGYLSSFTDSFHALVPASDKELRAAEAAFLASSTIITNDSGKIEVGHSATAYVVDSSGTVRVEWPFGIDKDAMVNDFRILLKSA
jgi:protein SCO1/2